MKLYTSNIRVSAREALDRFVTVAITAGKSPLFGPSWDIVTAYRGGHISEEEYTLHYLSEMRDSLNRNKDGWDKFIRSMSESNIVLPCFEAKGEFCHRYLLVQVLMAVAKSKNVDVSYAGEIMPSGKVVRVSLKKFPLL